MRSNDWWYLHSLSMVVMFTLTAFEQMVLASVMLVAVVVFFIAAEIKDADEREKGEKE